MCLRRPKPGPVGFDRLRVRHRPAVQCARGAPRVKTPRPQEQAGGLRDRARRQPRSTFGALRGVPAEGVAGDGWPARAQGKAFPSLANQFRAPPLGSAAPMVTSSRSRKTRCIEPLVPNGIDHRVSNCLDRTRRISHSRLKLRGECALPLLIGYKVAIQELLNVCRPIDSFTPMCRSV